MGRQAKTRTLSVWMNGARVGSWTLKANGGQEFAYAASWLDSSAARPISLSMPLRPASQPYKDHPVAAYFDNLLPDNRDIRERIQRRFRVRSLAPFDLLAEVGRDCVGALQLLGPEDEPAPVRQIHGQPLAPDEIARILNGTLGGGPLAGLEEAKEFRISLAGAQEKTALLLLDGQWQIPLGTTPTTHILKLPIGMGHRGIDLSQSVENEWLCARILRAYGVEVAHCWMEHFGEHKVLVVERFDRKPAADGTWLVRLPQEDLCQATGTPGGLKYENDGGPGIQNIMELLLGSSRAETDRQDFFRTQILFWMLCAIDGHAKNFSLFLQRGGNFRLTPRYDVISAYPVLGASSNRLSPHDVKMAMAVIGKNRHYHWHAIQYRHWLRTAKRCGLQDAAPKIIDALIEQTPTVLTTVQDQLPADFPAELADSILGGLTLAAKRLDRQRLS